MSTTADTAHLDPARAELTGELSKSDAKIAELEGQLTAVRKTSAKLEDALSSTRSLNAKLIRLTKRYQVASDANDRVIAHLSHQVELLKLEAEVHGDVISGLQRQVQLQNEQVKEMEGRVGELQAVREELEKANSNEQCERDEPATHPVTTTHSTAKAKRWRWTERLRA